MIRRRIKQRPLHPLWDCHGMIRRHGPPLGAVVSSHPDSRHDSGVNIGKASSYHPGVKAV
jgi:hypothetical protein